MYLCARAQVCVLGGGGCWRWVGAETEREMLVPVHKVYCTCSQKNIVVTVPGRISLTFKLPKGGRQNFHVVEVQILVIVYK